MKKVLATILALVMALGVTTISWATQPQNDGSEAHPYTLTEFNNLTEIPADTTDVYVNIDDISLTGAGKCATVGNYKISDQYMWVHDGGTAPEGYSATARRNAQENATAYRTNKAGYTVHVLGTLTAENYSDGNFSGFQTLCFQLPEKCTVVLEEMTLNGSFNISGSYTYMYNLYDGSIGHLQNPIPEGYTNIWYGFPFMIESIKLSGCTVNGQWLGNGDIAKSVEISNCTFNDYNNTGNANWANPIWWKNASNTDLTITDCEVTSTRPMKVGEGGVGNVTVADNTFTMLPGDKYTGVAGDKVKNTALSFGPEVKGDVKISNNTVEGSATALVSLLDTNMTMPEGKTFQVISNKLPDGAKTTVKWKEATEATIDFVEVTPYIPEPTPPRYYYNSTTTTDTKKDETKGSPKTFDAGIGIYAVTAVLSVTGMAWTAKKRH